MNEIEHEENVLPQDPEVNPPQTSQDTVSQPIPESVHQRIEEERIPQTGNPFEALMNESEMEFIQKMMPKGYSLSTSFRTIRPRTSKYVDIIYY